MEKFCKSCGMPMDNPEDFANRNTDSDYCCYCGESKFDKEKLVEKEEFYRKKVKKKRK